MKPLSVGDVVSAGLRIYRDNFKKYYKLALISYLWIFVPVYGWAKYSAIMGTIARLAFKEVAEQPESVRDAKRYTEPRKWYFFVTGLLVSLIFSGFEFPLAIALLIFLAIAGFISEQLSGVLGTLLIVILGIATLLIAIFAIVWLVSKLFLVELPLAVEENANAASTIGRSWQLTKGSVGRIQLIIFLVFLISMPIGIVTILMSAILLSILSLAIKNVSAIATISVFVYIAFLFASSVFMLPIWQSVKAVIYYDLRLRREGMGISLRK